MRKRLRKKLGLREFDVPIVPLAFRVRTNADRDAVLNSFITDAVESNGVQFGGGGAEMDWSGFLEPQRRTSWVTAEQIDAVQAWLAAERGIERFFIGQPMRSRELHRVLKLEPDFPESRLTSDDRHVDCV